MKTVNAGRAGRSYRCSGLWIGSRFLPDLQRGEGRIEKSEALRSLVNNLGGFGNV